MRFRVSLLETYDGGEPDSRYLRGIVVESRHESALDLIVAANDEWSTRPLAGEKYLIEPLACQHIYRVLEDGRPELLA